jgi:acetate kinase
MKDTGKSVVPSSHELQRLLTINGGSSSIRFALYAASESLRLLLPIELNQKRNAKNVPLISPDACRVKVRVIRTD